jgi:hypothetical protein
MVMREMTPPANQQADKADNLIPMWSSTAQMNRRRINS